MKPAPNADTKEDGDTIFERRESRVRSYAHSFPTKFASAQGARVIDESGNEYIDFLAGCSSLNYGHNHPDLKNALLDYVSADGIAHGLDMETEAKERFLEVFERKILRPRGMDYVVQFPGPTGANAIEAALKIARNVTGRCNVIAFTNGFHGCTLGALALTGNSHQRGASGLPLSGVTRAPFDGYFGDDVNTAEYLDEMLSDPSSGVDAPAAIIVETVQGEGGLNVASEAWLREIEKIARRHGALFIIDDIQAGVGRTGPFFSFETAGVEPDIVTLAKSISGFGLPMALTLFRRPLDVWKPGEHNGTFRGNCHAFVTAAAAIDIFWSDQKFEHAIRKKGQILKARLLALSRKFGSSVVAVKGRGMMMGIDVKSGVLASSITGECFSRGLLIETSGPEDQVVKCLAPLTIGEDAFEKGLDILFNATELALADRLKATA